MQGVLHWVAEPSPGVDPLKVEVRLFDKLFKSEVGDFYLVTICFIRADVTVELESGRT